MASLQSLTLLNLAARFSGVSKIPVVGASAPPCPLVQLRSFFQQRRHVGRSAPPQPSILRLRAHPPRVECGPRRGKTLPLPSQILADQSKKRPSFVVHSARKSTEQPPLTNAQPGNEPHDLKPEAAPGLAVGQFASDETRPSSLTYSSFNSQMPSLDTPDSSPSVQPALAKDEHPVPRQAAPSDNPNAERDQICSSPTWDKGTSRKERRATKRLEAERKDLEKRLLHLEEAQARLENGNYDRNSRRLTKKQPIGSSNRSSSANSGRPRSISGFSSFFSGSRRSSRSRSSSVTGKDRDSSRRQSTENPDGAAPSGPPSLPLIIPERFGAVISRELATKHGAGLVPSHQLHQRHTLHSSLKSDDLHESWRMAEAWQKKNGDRDSDQDLSGPQPELYLGGQFTNDTSWRRYEPRVTSQPTELSADLDRERFTATLRQERNPAEIAPSSINWSTRGRVASGPSTARAKNAPKENHPQVSDPASTRIATSRQLRDLAAAGSDQGLSNSRISPSSTPPAQGMPVMSKKERVDPNSQAHPRMYKSSPLAMNPANTNDFVREGARTPRALTVAHADHLHVPQPLRVSKPYQFEEPRGRPRGPAHYHFPAEASQGRNRDMRHEQRQSLNGPVPASARHDRRQQENRPPGAGAYDPRQQQTPADVGRAARVSPPVKNPDRKIPAKELAAKRLSGEKQALSSPTADVTTPQLESTEPSHSVPGELLENKHRAKVVEHPGHLRSLSGTSTRTTSSYDTADEEVLDVPKVRAADHQTQTQVQAQAQAPTSVPTSEPSSPAAEASTPVEPHIIPTSLRDPPPLAPGGPVAMLRRKPMQKVNPFEPNQVVAKLFVICCHCNYWHDMPSEVYAKLACPERLPSDSLLVRTFSRKNSLGRRNSLFSSDPDGQRRLSFTRKTQAPDTQASRSSNGENESPSSQSAAQPGPLYRPQCCWCGHSMGKTCCQGWTTIVHMRERHH